MTTFAEARSRFPVCDRFAYLNAGTFGPLSAGTAEAAAAEAGLVLAEGRSGADRHERASALRGEIRGALATLLSVAPDQVSLNSSTSEGCGIVLAGLDLGPDDEIVTTDVEHPGLIGPLGASRATVRVARLRGRPAAEATDTILAEVGPRTRLLALSHVAWLTGQRIDVHALRERSGIPILVDGAQSAGAIPVEAGGLDFYTVSCQEWLCGPDPTGALVVADPAALRVPAPSYLGIASSEQGGACEPRPGAERFDSLSHSLATLAGLAHAVREAPGWRFERARDAAARCRELLMDAGIAVVTEPAQATLVTFRAPGGDAPAAAARAAEQDVVIRFMPRTEWIRASCGYWTSDDDLARLVAAVAR